MTTETTDRNPQTESKLYKNLEDNPPITVNEAQQPYPEEELISHEEFRRHIEKRVYERLGFKITLPTTE